MGKVSDEELTLWKLNAVEHRRQIADAYHDRENGLDVRAEIVRLWTKQPIIFFAELREVLDQGELELKNVVCQLLGIELNNDERRDPE